MARTSQNSTHLAIEQFVNAVEQQGGLLTDYPVVINNSLTVNGTFTQSGTSAETITSTSANALAVGPNGTTDPVFNINASAASAVTGLDIVSAAAGSGLALEVTSSATDENATLDAKGSGTLTLNGTATGTVDIGHGLAVTGNVTSTGTIIATGGLGTVYSESLTPASVAADTSAEQTFTVTGLVTGQGVIVNGPAPTAGTGIVNARVSAANTLAITFGNFTAGALTPTSGVYLITQI